MKTILEKLIKNRKLRMLVGQYKEISEKFTALSEQPQFLYYNRLLKIKKNSVKII